MHNLLFLYISPFFTIVEIEMMLGSITKEEMSEVIEKVEEDIREFRKQKIG